MDFAHRAGCDCRRDLGSSELVLDIASLRGRPGAGRTRIAADLNLAERKFAFDKQLAEHKTALDVNLAEKRFAFEKETVAGGGGIIWPSRYFPRHMKPGTRWYRRARAW